MGQGVEYLPISRVTGANWGFLIFCTVYQVEVLVLVQVNTGDCTCKLDLMRPTIKDEHVFYL